MASTTTDVSVSVYNIAKEGFGTGTNELYDRYAINFSIRTWIDVVRALVHGHLTRLTVYRTSGKQFKEVRL